MDCLLNKGQQRHDAGITHGLRWEQLVLVVMVMQSREHEHAAVCCTY